jgi:FAD/FMN-containing dehydrogenase
VSSATSPAAASAPSRTYGISSDSVLAFDVVTGDGVLRRATPTEHPELFWGLRGGKATLGVVTAVEIELPELAELYGGSIWFADQDSAAALAAWRHMARILPDEATTSVAVMNPPPLPHLPPAIAGRQTLAVRYAWTGDRDSGAAYLAELRDSATALVDTVGPMPYSEIGRIHADPVDPMPVSSRSALLGELPEEAVDAFLDAVGEHGPHTVVELRALGGAIARAPQHPSAVCHRDAAYQLFMSGVPTPDGAGLAAHADSVLGALAPWTMPGLLPNFAASDDPATIARYYDPATMARFATLADRYDPDHVLDTGQVARTAGEQHEPTAGDGW